ncbi:hypothetical protein HPP92_028980 [Vanilla planifolia]|uniref:Uncharacterized protein n=1 Tax=Vanilla planifolia TaxID=51239 RepID=A0A835U1N5_VANPL|nr:hypothetical protein HPP92_028980 [Vanilla planifolia]KAG0446158.1 hypothetical protein HPP92_028969 [Vanilla planifolia]
MIKSSIETKLEDGLTSNGCVKPVHVSIERDKLIENVKILAATGRQSWLIASRFSIVRRTALELRASGRDGTGKRGKAISSRHADETMPPSLRPITPETQQTQTALAAQCHMRIAPVLMCLLQLTQTGWRPVGGAVKPNHGHDIAINWAGYEVW